MAAFSDTVARADGAAGLRALSALDSLIAGTGTRGHPYVTSDELLHGRDSARNLADAVHYLCVLHGRLPTVIDLAGAKAGLSAIGGWLGTAATGFALERSYLTRLVVAVGPIPSTAGQAEAEAAVVAQHHALEMLARSERTGCALGAAIGLVLDWPAVRPVLDAAADRVGIARVPCAIPSYAETQAFALEVATGPSVERALRFGIEQILAQHDGLWSLLQSREHARRLH
jgi:hypothetical protein